MRIRWGWLGIAAFLLPASADMLPRATRKPGAGPYFRIRRGELWGFMDAKGKTVIAPQFEAEGDFFAGRARVRKNRSWGYIDEQGRLAIPFQFDDAGDFVEGLAPVSPKPRGGWGIIDTSGKFIVQPHLGAIGEYREGLARFEDWERIECESDGNEMLSYTKADAPDVAFILHDGSNDDLGLIPCRGGKFGYLDREGKVAIAPQFDIAFDFSDGRAVIRQLRNGYLAYGYIDRTGSVVVEPKLDDAFDFSEGLGVVTVSFQPNRSGVIDRNGNFVIPPEFAHIGPFSEGVAEACVVYNHCGFIDHSGRFVVPPRFESAQPFSEGWSLVWSLDSALPYYVDHTGNAVLKLGWTAWPFSGGLTVMRLGNRWAYVDRKGNIVGTYDSR